MAAAIASAALIVGASLAIGQAILRLCGRPDWSWLAGPVGLALILVVAGIAASLQARGTAIAVLIWTLLIASATILALRRRPGEGTAEHAAGSEVRRSGEGSSERRLGLGQDAPRTRDLVEHAPPSLLRTVAPATGAAFLAALFAALPFLAAGFVGVLGVGLVNDDMASHLLIADWIDERFRPEPVFIDQGYPLGPHALVAGLSTLLHASSIDVFAGLMLAIPALTALVAYSALDGLDRMPRIAASALTALPYMAAAYLAQEAFKEPIIALFLLAFALLLPSIKSPSQAFPLGVLAAGTVYVYSFPGLAWLAGVTIVWAVFTLRGRAGAVEGRRNIPQRSEDVPTSLRPTRAALTAVGVGVLTLLALVAPELPRIFEFTDFRALDPSKANEGGLGNLPGQISPLTSLGIWPTSEFRLAAGANSLPAIVFYAGALLAAIAFALALPRWIRRHGAAIPAALIAAVVLYVVARALGTVYTSAKAISIAAPLIALVTFGGLFAAKRTALTALATVFAIAAAASSFLILRQAPVGPEEHMQELAEIRPLVQGEKLLFLGRDNFFAYELRGSRPFTHVRTFYNADLFVEPNFELERVGSKFDFDSVTGETLARFPYVLTTKAAYASGPPPGYTWAAETESYMLWRRGNQLPVDRLPGETNDEPGRIGGCPGNPTSVGVLAAAPVQALPAKWSDATIENGDLATIELQLGPGTWDLSLQYDATRAVTLTDELGSLDETVPGNLDYRGTGPFWPAGRVEVPGEDVVEITASVEAPPLTGRLLGAHSVAHLGAIAASSARREPLGRPGPACDLYVDWYESR